MFTIPLKDVLKGGSSHKNWCMAKVLGFLIRYFSNYYTLHRSDLAARAAPLDPRLRTESIILVQLFKSSIERMMEKHTVFLWYLNAWDGLWNGFDSYFDKIVHGKNTRNAGKNVL